MPGSLGAMQALRLGVAFTSLRAAATRSPTDDERMMHSIMSHSRTMHTSDEDKREIAQDDAQEEQMSSGEIVALYNVSWPAEGQTARPPHSPETTALFSGVRVWQVELAMITAVGVATLAVLYRLGVPPEARSGRGERPGMLERFRDTEFGTHVAALVEANKRRQFHRRAVWGHLWRVGVPAAFLLLIHSLRSKLQRQVRKGGALEMVAGFAAPDVVVDGILDYALSLVLVFVSLAGMTSFCGNVASMTESGFRHLLHVSGLSRQAFAFAIVLVDGVLQNVLSLGVVLFVSGAFLQVRVVEFTSPVLLVAEVFLLSAAAIVFGYFLCFASRNAANVGKVVQMVFWTLGIVMPFVIFHPVVPMFRQQSWLAIAVPIIPAYHSMFELVAGCLKGRCLGLDDVADGLRSGGAVPPWYMVVGQGAEQRTDITPPQAISSFAGMAMLQLLVVILAACYLECRRHPALHTATARVDGRAEKPPAGLQVENLTHCYGWLGSGRQRTLKDVSFTVTPGSTLGLLGPNGAGKTTAIRCITGEEAALEGTISLPRRRSGAYIGLCPQETVVNYDLTVGENLTFFANLRGKWGREAEQCVNQVLFATRLQEKRDCLPETLSGGMRRRLSVGCTMVATPAVVILDEPTTGLDALTRRGVWDTIQEARAVGTICLLTTHMMEEAEFLSSHLVVMVAGAVAASGTVQQLKEEWGSGYALRIESELGQENMAREFMASLLPPASRKPKQGAQASQMIFNFDGDGEALGHLIIAIHKERAANAIRHWGVSQATLEETYLQIVQRSSYNSADA